MLSTLPPSRVSLPQNPRYAYREKRHPSPGAFEKRRPAPIERPPYPKGGRGLLDPAFVQKLRATNEARSLARGRKMERNGDAPGPSRAGPRSRGTNEPLDEITITGWTQSKAASNADGGIKSVLEFIKRKASKDDTVRIANHHTSGDALIISVDPEFTRSILRLNTFTFAGAQLHIQSQASSRSQLPNPEMSEEAKKLKEQLINFLNRRYDTNLKILDLSALGSEPEFSESSISQVFTALMLICETFFKTPEEKREAIVSVRLAHNNLRDLRSVSDLTSTFPDLRNLDLSNNNLKDLDSVCAWRPRLPHLEHLILSGNPLEAKVSDYEDAVFKRIPSLQFLNSKQRPVKDEIQKFALPVSDQHINAPSPGWNVMENICKPETWGFPAEEKSEENMIKEQLVFHLSKESLMTFELSAECLEENGWKLEEAYGKWQNVKDDVPAHGYMRIDSKGRFVGCGEVAQLLRSQGYLA